VALVLILIVLLLPEGVVPAVLRRWRGRGVPPAIAVATAPVAAGPPAGTVAAALECRDVWKAFGGIQALRGVTLKVAPGEIVGLVGPNGSGKTTLINVVSGHYAADRGRIALGDEPLTGRPAHAIAGLGVSRTYQIPRPFAHFTALDNVALAVQAHAGHSFRFWRPARAETALREPARVILEQVGLGERGDVAAGTLAHGEQRQLEIAMALATRPTLLLLDEPVAGMGADESARMIQLLRALRGHHTMLLVEHDMDAVFALADRISVMVDGRVIATGAPEAIRANPEVRRAYLGEEVSA
jgi:branched-chain amino acid transport system ATP-binding protein